MEVPTAKRIPYGPRIAAVAARVPLKKLILVYNGWELVYHAESRK